MDKEIENQAVRLVEEAQKADRGSDWKTSLAKSEQGLQIEGLWPEMEIFLRRFRAKAILHIFIGDQLKIDGEYSAYKENNLKKAIEDLKIVTQFLFKNRGSALFVEIDRDYHYYGLTLYALHTIVRSPEEKRYLVTQAIEQMEMSLVISPGAINTGKLLDKFRDRLYDFDQTSPIKKSQSNHSDARSVSSSSGGCMLVTIVVVILVCIVVGVYFASGSKQTANNTSRQSGSIRRINTENLNLRAGPGANQSVIMRLPQGIEIIVLNETQNIGGAIWVKVQAGQQEGWVNQKYLQ